MDHPKMLYIVPTLKAFLAMRDYGFSVLLVQDVIFVTKDPRRATKVGFHRSGAASVVTVVVTCDDKLACAWGKQVRRGVKRTDVNQREHLPGVSSWCVTSEILACAKKRK